MCMWKIKTKERLRQIRKNRGTSYNSKKKRSSNILVCVIRKEVLENLTQKEHTEVTREAEENSNWLKYDSKGTRIDGKLWEIRETSNFAVGKSHIQPRLERTSHVKEIYWWKHKQLANANSISNLVSLIKAWSNWGRLWGFITSTTHGNLGFTRWVR